MRTLSCRGTINRARLCISCWGTIHRALRVLLQLAISPVRLAPIFVVSMLLAPASYSAPDTTRITGIVRNATTGQLAAGDDVLLLRPDLNSAQSPDQRMTEAARAKTDSQGAFSFDAKAPATSCLIRVVHQGVNYDQPCSPAKTLFLQVFDSASHVDRIAGSIEILRVGADGPTLHVSDMYEIRNDSDPPMTQVAPRTFEVYLPPQARLTSVHAAAPGKTGVTISASSIAGQPGNYSVSFSLEPGATKFAFNYDVPYTGHAAFKPRAALPFQQFFVMLPPTMKFLSNSPSFKVLPTASRGYQAEAATQLSAGPGPRFEVSGSGPLPSLTSDSSTQSASANGHENSVPSQPSTQPAPAADSPAHSTNSPMSTATTPAAKAPGTDSTVSGRSSAAVSGDDSTVRVRSTAPVAGTNSSIAASSLGRPPSDSPMLPATLGTILVAFSAIILIRGRKSKQ